MPSLAQHSLGQIQYELTNHLGNVQATVSDKKIAILDNAGRIRLFHSSIAAVYDYYPFGMLMRERTAIDTSSRPSYVSRLVSVPVLDTGVVALSGGTTGVSYGATLSYANGGVTMTGMNGELGILVTGLTPGLPVRAHVKIGYLGAGAQLSARDSADGVQLGSVSVSSTGSWDIVFTPTEGRAILKVGLFPYFGQAKTLVTVDQVTWSEQVGVDYRTQLVRVGSRIGDRYEFGFNGQMKTDELAGLGNHNTALFWEYDARLARRWNLDPVDQVSLSNYSVFGDNPVVHNDPDGDKFDKSTEKRASKFEDETRTRIDANKKRLAAIKEEKSTLNAEFAPGVPNLAALSKLQSLESEEQTLNSDNYEYMNAMIEVDQLRKSPQLYHIRAYMGDIGSDDVGLTYYDPIDNSVVMSFAYNNIGYLAHELHHGYQYDIGQTSYMHDFPQRPGFLNSLVNEVESYRREGAYNDEDALRNITAAKVLERDPRYGPFLIGPFNSKMKVQQILSPEKFKQLGDVLKKDPTDKTYKETVGQFEYHR